MKQSSRPEYIFLSVLLLALMSGCGLLRPAGVEVLVPEPEVGHVQAPILSPDGKKLLYGRGGGTTFLLHLTTNQTRQIQMACGIYWWLDDETVLCDGDDGPALVSAESLVPTPIQTVTIKEQDMEGLIHPDLEIYHFEDRDMMVLLRSHNPTQTYLITDGPVEHPALEGLPVRLIPRPPYTGTMRGAGKVFSPDGQHYYLDGGSALQIYSADDQLVRDVEIKGGISSVAGWMYDSSGVIYNVSPIGLMSTGGPSPIYKLTVPR